MSCAHLPRRLEIADGVQLGAGARRQNQFRPNEEDGLTDGHEDLGHTAPIATINPDAIWRPAAAMTRLYAKVLAPSVAEESSDLETISDQVILKTR